jgi:hypothetical protein
MTWKAYAAVSGAGLLATYLFSTPPAVAPERGSSPQNAARPAAAPTVADIQTEALRLQSRIEPEHDYQQPSRDPFRFNSRKPRTAATPPATAPPPPPLAPPEPPPIRLSGIVSRTEGGRMAIFILPQGPVEAKEGDPVGFGYTVTRVTEDAVELTGPNGVLRRLQLRP